MPDIPMPRIRIRTDADRLGYRQTFFVRTPSNEHPIGVEHHRQVTMRSDTPYLPMDATHEALRQLIRDWRLNMGYCVRSELIEDELGRQLRMAASPPDPVNCRSTTVPVLRIQPETAFKIRRA